MTARMTLPALRACCMLICATAVTTASRPKPSSCAGTSAARLTCDTFRWDPDALPLSHSPCPPSLSFRCACVCVCFACVMLPGRNMVPVAVTHCRFLPVFVISLLTGFFLHSDYSTSICRTTACLMLTSAFLSSHSPCRPLNSTRWTCLRTSLGLSAAALSRASWRCRLTLAGFVSATAVSALDSVLIL